MKRFKVRFLLLVLLLVPSSSFASHRLDLWYEQPLPKKPSLNASLKNKYASKIGFAILSGLLLADTSAQKLRYGAWGAGAGILLATGQANDYGSMSGYFNSTYRWGNRLVSDANRKFLNSGSLGVGEDFSVINQTSIEVFSEKRTWQYESSLQTWDIESAYVKGIGLRLDTPSGGKRYSHNFGIYTSPFGLFYNVKYSPYVVKYGNSHGGSKSPFFNLEKGPGAEFGAGYANGADLNFVRLLLGLSYTINDEDFLLHLSVNLNREDAKVKLKNPRSSLRDDYLRADAKIGKGGFYLDVPFEIGESRGEWHSSHFASHYDDYGVYIGLNRGNTDFSVGMLRQNNRDYFDIRFASSIERGSYSLSGGVSLRNIRRDSSPLRYPNNMGPRWAIPAFWISLRM
jgi:hypothetical protein